MDDQSLQTLTKITKLVASGQSTDYDALAKKKKKTFAKDFQNIIPFTKHTLADYHREGSKILKSMQDQNLIRVQFRGKTRRGVIDLETGRHHQIRAQLSFIGSPIKGDLKYGAPRSNKDGSIHLHAREIHFTHPVSKNKIIIKAPTPDEVIWNACM